MPILLVLVLTVTSVTLAREWTSAPLDSIPIDSPVLIELIPDSLPIGFDREGRWMLVKTDSVPGSGSPRAFSGYRNWRCAMRGKRCRSQEPPGWASASGLPT